MAETPEWLRDKLLAYFHATNERSYLAHWSGRALSFHLGIGDETTKSLDEAHLASNALLAERLGIVAGSRVLDAGCGVGGTSIWLAERGAITVGITLDPDQVEHARRFAAERGVGDKTTFEVMDYAATTLAAASFDAVFNLESLCHANDPRAVVAHLATLLRPGGAWGAMDYFRPASDDQAIADRVADGWVLPGLSKLEDVASIARTAGLEDVAADDLTPRVCVPAAQLGAMSKNTLMMMRLQKAIDGAEDPVFEGHVRAAVAASEGLAGAGLAYGLVTGRAPAQRRGIGGGGGSVAT